MIDRYVRLVLEAMKTPASAASEGLALCAAWDAEIPSLILYSTSAVREVLSQFETGQPPADIADDEEAMFFWSHDSGLKLADPRIVVGFMALVPPEQGHCYGAQVVQLAAAEKGYGPLLYDTALNLLPNHTLVSDRKSVSFAAQRVWDTYYNGRGDIEALPLDNVKDPKTPPPEDDCLLHPSSRPVLNFAYRGPGKDPNGLLRAHEAMWKAVARLAQRKGLAYTRDDFQEQLYRAGRLYFGHRYNGDF